MTTWRRQGQTFGPVIRDMFGTEAQYVQALQRADAHVFLVPQAPTGVEPDDVLDGFDGLVLIGGEDLAADVSGVEPHLVGDNASAPRDRWEMGLLTAALDRDLPVLAICRGLQLLNVALGGDLHGDIAGTSPEHPPVPRELKDSLAYRHAVQVAEGSVLARVFGTESAQVNSLHHQSVDRLAPLLRTTALAADGTVEAVEHQEAAWCVGVQWHPELMPDDPLQQALFAEFVRATEARRTSSAGQGLAPHA